MMPAAAIPAYQAPNNPEFPMQVTTEWRFMAAVCMLANAVAFAVQAFFEGQVLYAGGFVFLGLSALFGIYYLFQARALDDHVVHYVQECNTLQGRNEKLAEENLRVCQEKRDVEDQARAVAEAISQWYTTATQVTDHGLDEIASDAPDSLQRITGLLVRKHGELHRDLQALLKEDEKRRQFEELAKQRSENADRSLLLEQQSEVLASAKAAFELRERTFNEQREKFVTALSILDFSATQLHGLSASVTEVAEEVGTVSKETARTLGIVLKTPRLEENGLRSAALQRLVTFSTPSKTRLQRHDRSGSQSAPHTPNGDD
jgi:hypothetical protein